MGGREGFHGKPISRGGRFLKKRAWTICKFKGGLSRKEEDGVFLGEGGDTPINTMSFKKKKFIKRTIYKLHALHLINFQKKMNESRFEKALKVVQKRSNFLLR